MVVVAIIAIATASWLLFSHRDNQSTIGAMVALDTVLEEAKGIAKSSPTGATVAIEPDPLQPALFRTRVFLGTPKLIGDTLTLHSTESIPMDITGSAQTPQKSPGETNLYPTKWKTVKTGIIDIFISNYGDTDFAEDYDPAVAAPILYPGCATNTEIQLAFHPIKTANPVDGEFGSLRLACGESTFRQYDAKNNVIVKPTPTST